MINMMKLESERIFKLCELPMKSENDSYKFWWLRTHIKWLRAGDTFKIRDNKYLATSDPYFRVPENDPVKQIMGLTNKKEKEDPGWTIRFVRQ